MANTDFKVTIQGFKTKAQALRFLEWYEGGGEQAFYEHLNIIDKDPDDGCSIDVNFKGNHRGNNKGCYVEDADGYTARVK